MGLPPVYSLSYMLTALNADVYHALSRDIDSNVWYYLRYYKALIYPRDDSIYIIHYTLYLIALFICIRSRYRLFMVSSASLSHTSGILQGLELYIASIYLKCVCASSHMPSRDIYIYIDSLTRFSGAVKRYSLVRPALSCATSYLDSSPYPLSLFNSYKITHLHRFGFNPLRSPYNEGILLLSSSVWLCP